MYKIIIGVLIAGAAHANVSVQQTQELWRSVQQASGQRANLYIINGGVFDTYSNYKGTFISRKMMQFLNSKSEMAMVLGHEMGHIAHGDVYGRRAPPKQEELEADVFGYRLAKGLGYSHPETTLLHFKQAFGNRGDNQHPSWSVRYKYIMNHGLVIRQCPDGSVKMPWIDCYKCNNDTPWRCRENDQYQQ